MDNLQLPNKEHEVHQDSALPAERRAISTHEIQPASPTPVQRRQTSHTAVNISDDASAETSEEFLCPQAMFNPFFYACYLCVAAVLLAVISGLVVSCSVIATAAALPLLLLSLLVTRLLQFFLHGDAYEKAIQLKIFIRFWILLVMVVFLIVLWITSSVPENVPGLKQLVLLELNMADWVKMYNGIFAIYVLSCVVSVVTINLLPLVPLDHTESGLNVPESVLEIIDCLIFWLAESQVMESVTAFRQHRILGLYTRKWIEVSIFVLIAYNFIKLSTHMLVLLLRRLVCYKILHSGINDKSRRYLIIEKFLRRRYLVYWVNGMKRSINFILSSLLLLLIWVSYFGSHLNNTTQQAKDVLDFGTWTFLSLLFCSFLWLIKTCALLSWEASSVYNRLNLKIIEGAKQLYFLGIIGRHTYDILSLLYECTVHESHESHESFRIYYSDSDTEKVRELTSDLCNTLFPKRVMTLHAHYLSKFDYVDEWEDGQGILLTKKKKRVEQDLLMQEGRTPTLYCLQQAAGYFLTAKSTLLKEKYTCDILENLKSHNTDDDKGRFGEHLKGLVQAGNTTENETENLSKDAHRERDNWMLFEILLRECVGSAQEISLDEIQTWMERARNNCLFLANTLSSAKEVVDCLNKIISWLLIVACFIMWLLLTGLATTKILVLIASPLLAATFIFGDACKTLFQGIMFAYVVHPFDVGDLCAIDGQMMEVKTVGVWKTTFAKVGMQEDLIYPNSELCNKNIINYKTEYDWNDYVELDVTSLDGNEIKSLKQEIEKYLDGNGYSFTPSHNSVEVLTTGDNVKVAVNFRHNAKLKNSTYFECLKEKRKRRSEFVLHVQRLVNHTKNRGSDTSALDTPL